MGSSGHVACWDLEKRKLSHQMRSCHSAHVANVTCLTGEPLLVTNSKDNTLKQWIFDMCDGGGRLLRWRTPRRKRTRSSTMGRKRTSMMARRRRGNPRASVTQIAATKAEAIRATSVA